MKIVKVEKLSFGERLAELMKNYTDEKGNKRKMTQEELSGLLVRKKNNDGTVEYVSTTSIRKWLKSDTPPKKKWIEQLAKKIFHVDEGYLECTQIEKKNCITSSPEKEDRWKKIQHDLAVWDLLESLGYFLDHSPIDGEPVIFDFINDGYIYTIEQFEPTVYETTISNNGKCHTFTESEFNKIIDDIQNFIKFTIDTRLTEDDPNPHEPQRKPTRHKRKSTPSK